MPDLTVPPEITKRVAYVLRYPLYKNNYVQSVLDRTLSAEGQDWLDQVRSLLDQVECARAKLTDAIAESMPFKYSLQGAYSLEYSENTNPTQSARSIYKQALADLILLVGLEQYNQNNIIRN